MPAHRIIPMASRLLVPALLLALAVAAGTVAADLSDGQMPGFGMTLAAQDGKFVVTATEPDGIAHRAGVRAGDTFLSVDGVSLDGSTMEQVYARLVSPRADAVNLMVRRKSGGRQELRLKRPKDNLGTPPARPALTLKGSAPSAFAGPQSDGRANVIARSGLSVGDEMIDFTLPRLGGGEVKLSEYRGKPILLDFWATWCGPCRASAPALAAVYRAYGEEVQIIGVSLDYAPGIALQYAQEEGLDYPQALSKGWEDPVIQSFGIHRTGIPFNILYDSKGHIAAMDLHGQPLADALELLLRKE